MHILFGKKLRKQRTKLGLSTLDLAKACGVSRSYITLIENSKRLPGKKILLKIAAALKLEAKIVLNWYLEDISHKIEENIIKN